MIRLSLPVTSEAMHPYVARLAQGAPSAGSADAVLLDAEGATSLFAGPHGLLAVDGALAGELDGDIVLVQPQAGRLERLIRKGSAHNTLLVTERCDQLCQMCSQPPKKTHVDRFDALEQACLLAEPGTTIGITGGEPTLYKEQLLGMLERVLAERPDLQFHVLTNGQHFDAEDTARLRDPRYDRVTWGIPLYAADAALHDHIVGKEGAYIRLRESFAYLLLAGARVELRTVIVADNVAALPMLAERVAAELRFVESWSIMQLEHIGFAKNRWAQLYVDHARDFAPLALALDWAVLHGIDARLFNFARCTLPEGYRDFAPASISDWKRKYAPGCEGCREQQQCAGFFEWHPEEALQGVTPL